MRNETYEFASSAIKSAVYDHDTGKLEILMTNGRTYPYFGVEPQTWVDFKASESAGRFYDKRIKGRYLD